MERVFSVDEIAEQLWPDESSKSMMNRSASEWAFQRFLQEAQAASSSSTVEIKPNINAKPNTNGPHHHPSEDYQAILKTKLNLACAAVALSRGSLVKFEDPTASHDSGSQSSNPSQVVSQATLKGSDPSGNDSSKLQNKEAKVPVGVPSLPAMQKKPAIAIRQTTSGSSRDQSDDEEAEGEMDMSITENMDPADAKRVRR